MRSMRWTRCFPAFLLIFSLSARAELVGKIDAAFAVSASGAATYEIPITVPPGTAGMQPALALAYDSHRPNGALGAGFALTGQSAIGRCPSDLARDGAIRAVALDRGDRLCLDGERLVAVAGSYGMPGSEYRTERESYARIVALGSADPTDRDAGPREFRVFARDGRIRFYGSSDDARIEAQGTRRVRLWALARVEDRFGNAMRFRYDEDPASGEFELARIDYTENAGAGLAPYASVRLVWELRPDPESGYFAGSRAATARRLAALETWFAEERVREYRLAYAQNPQTGRSRLASVTLCGLGGECLPPTVFAWEQGLPGWSEVPAWDLPRQLWADSKQEGELADLNADGLVDFVHDGNASQKRATWLNDGDGFAQRGAWTTPDDLFSENLGMPHALFTDVNGDGLPDYVRSYRSVGGDVSSATYLNTGSGWAGAASPAWRVSDYLWDYSGDHNRQRGMLMDLNGDDLPDAVIAYDDGDTPVRRTRLNTGSGFGARDDGWKLPASLWAFTHGEHHTEAALVDLNGDGLPDLLQATTDNDDRDHKAVWLNTGSGFAGPVAAWTPPVAIWDYSPGAVDPSAKAVRQTALLADVNGDGLPDFVVCFQGQGGGRVQETYLNSGAGWVRSPAWDAPYYAWTYAAGKNRMTAQLVDVNGDGFPDMVRAFDSSRDVRQLDTWLNTRAGFPGEEGETAAYAPPTPIWSYAPSPAETRATFADLNGDGMADLVKAIRTDATTTRQSFINRGALRDRVVEIRDGLGATTQIEYAPLTDPSAYEIGERAPYPQLTVVDPTRVVRRVGSGASAAALRFVSFRYGNLRYDRLRRLSLGFAWRESTDESSGLVTTESGRQDWPFQGLADATVRARSDGTVIARTRHVYDLVPGSPPGVNAIVERETQDEKFELDGTAASAVTTRREHDAFGNVAVETVEWSDGVSRTTRSEFENDAARWRIGLVRRIAMTASAPGGEPQTRTRASLYDAAGRLVHETLEPDHPELRLDRALSYDVFGNLAATETTGAGLDPQSEFSFADPRGQHPILELNPLGQARRNESDPRFGAAVLVFDPNPDVPPTRFALDPLGRPLSTTRPDGVTATTTRGLCDAACPVGAAMFARTDTPGSGSVTQYLDALGRELRRATLGFDGRPVFADTAYDLRGNPIRRSRPYYAGDAAQLTEVRFDELDRPVESREPNGALTTYAYAPLAVAVTDPLRHVRTERRDARGALVERIDPGGGHTRFTLDGFGQVVLVLDPAGNATRTRFDLRGRVVAVDDPNLGAWTYRYDALGRRTAQVEPLGTETRFTYDALGRMVRREDGGSATTWTWDIAANGIGRLARVASWPSGIVREESYDSLGRPSATATRIATGALRIARSYDEFGRVSRVSYPSGFSVVQRYTESGQLESIRDAAGTAVLWRAESRVADGRVERERLGNGLRTDRLYDVPTGRLKRILTGSDTAPSVQSLSYDWDLRGNLLGRRDQNLALAEAFAYDELDRLESATSPQLGALDLRYDEAGNLVYKTGHGAYQYAPPGSARPHAVLATSGDGRRFSYDAKGNLIDDGAGRSLVWSARNELIALSQSGADGAFEFLGYGPEGELLTRHEIDASASGSSTWVVQLGQLYESSTDLRTGRVEQRHMIYAEGALVAVHTTSTQGGGGTRWVHRDHLESVNALTDASGAVVERIGYDPHGEVRRQPLGADDPATLLRVAPRGFAGAVQLRRSQLVHLGGRVYDPKLGRFLSPDPLAGAASDSQARNGYAYARNNPLSLVDPTGFEAEAPASSSEPPFGDSVLSALGSVWHFAVDAANALGAAFAGAVAAASSFLSSSWGGIRFAATAGWAGIGWAGGQLASGASALGTKAWEVYNDDFDLGILPARRTPLGLAQSVVQGFLQWKNQKLELWHVWRDGEVIHWREYDGPLAGNVSVNGQQNDLELAAKNALDKFDRPDCILAYNASENLVSDTVESALMKFAPSASGRQLAELISRAEGPLDIVGHSQGALIVFWGMRLADRRLDDVHADFFGPATSSLAYRYVLWKTGASEGRFGYSARDNDPVATFLGGNFTGALALPLLLPARLIFSAESIPLLPFPSVSPHSSYP